VARDLAAIRFHYDVGNNFYALWLDERLVYTCAYFETRETPLEEAQEAKLDLICRKLRLRPGMRLLDIGCGWGALVMFAAERYGVDATGITLSKAQADWATEEIDRRRLAGQARVLMRDYRDLGTFGHFDAVAAFGIIEHVGRNQLGPYFRLAFEAVRPGGLFSITGSPPPGQGDLFRVGFAFGGVGSYSGTSSPIVSSWRSRTRSVLPGKPDLSSSMFVPSLGRDC
jgi:cyclopropane-fatty-acyl-phospholipid synthase